MTPQERESAVLNHMERRFRVKQWRGTKAWDAVVAVEACCRWRPGHRDGVAEHHGSGFGRQMGLAAILRRR
jgi:hypothetical protein